MEKGIHDDSRRVLNTTVGELIEAVTQVALKAVKTEQEGYKLASLAVASILHKNKQNIDWQ